MNWPAVRLGEVAQQRKEFITLDDMKEYVRCRVQLHAQGIVERDRLPGAMIKTKQQQVCRSGEFLVAEIDAKHGGYGIVPNELDGAIVSSHYFLFEIDETRLDRQFLAYFARTPAFLEQVNAQGTTNYAAIRPQQVLTYEIPLPPLAEQKRIVAKIERLAGKIEEAQGLREEAVSLADSMLRSHIDEIFEDFERELGTTYLEGACDSITDGDHITPQSENCGVKFVFVGNVSSGKLHFDGCKYVTPDYFSRIQEYRRPRRGDVLYSGVTIGAVSCAAVAHGAGEGGLHDAG